MTNYKLYLNEMQEYLTPEMEKYFLRKLVGESIESIRIKILEFLKFCLIRPNVKYGIPFNEEIDEIWHLWILQTVQYRELMAKLPSKKFLEHSSADYGEEEIADKKSEINMQISFLATYVYYFGMFTEDTIHYWPYAHKLLFKYGNDFDKLNSYLLKLANDNINNYA